MENELQVMAEENYKNQFITVSNSLLRAKETTNLLESKIEALAMYYMGKEVFQKEKKDANGSSYKVNYVVIPSKEIISLMAHEYGEKKNADGNTYATIRKAALSMKQKLYIIENKEEGKFVMKSMYGDVSYNDGLLNVEFDPSMEKYFLYLRQNFSKLKLPILFSFKRNGGFQLYKLLKSYAYPPYLDAVDMSLPQEDQPYFTRSWNLTELKMEMGFIDITQNMLREEGSKNKPNFKKMEREEKNPSYKRWSDFYSRVLGPGIKELNELSDLYIKDVQKISSGRGGKVEGLTFVVQHNVAYYERQEPLYVPAAPKVEKKKPVVLTNEERDDFVDELDNVFKESLKAKDRRTIAEAAGYDMDRVKEIYAMANNENIDNLVGWMVKGLKDGYSKPVTKKKKNDFNDFDQRVYDYAELERDAVNM